MKQTTKSTNLTAAVAGSGPCVGEQAASPAEGASRTLRSWLVSCVLLACIVTLLPLHAKAQQDGGSSSVNQSPDEFAPSPLPTPAEQIPATLNPDLALPEVADNFVIGKDDLLAVFVYQMPEFTRQLRVSEAGTIELPFLNSPIKAAGHTSRELDHVIEAALVSQGLARNPRVQVIVRQVMSRPIVVAGAVRTPTVLQASRPMRLLEVLSRAGGPTNQAGDTVLVTSKTGVGTVTKQYNLTHLIQNIDPSDNILLTGGEQVRIVPAKMVYAVGALKRPGAFPMRTSTDITVLKVLALVEGFSDTVQPDKSHAEIIHTSADGQRQEIAVDLNKILRHSAPDLPLRSGDILYVPENGRRKVLAAVLQDVGQAAVIATGYRIGNF